MKQTVSKDSTFPETSVRLKKPISLDGEKMGTAAQIVTIKNKHANTLRSNSKRILMDNMNRSGKRIWADNINSDDFHRLFSSSRLNDEVMMESTTSLSRANKVGVKRRSKARQRKTNSSRNP